MDSLTIDKTFKILFRNQENLYLLQILVDEKVTRTHMNLCKSTNFHN